LLYDLLYDNSKTALSSHSITKTQYWFIWSHSILPI